MKTIEEWVKIAQEPTTQPAGTAKFVRQIRTEALHHAASLCLKHIMEGRASSGGGSVSSCIIAINAAIDAQ